MTHTSSDLLEFEALRALVGRHVASPGGREHLARVAPSAGRAIVDEALAETAEASSYLVACSKPQAAARGAAVRLRFDGLPDARPLLAKLAIEGSVLEGSELRQTGSLLDRACDVRAVLVAAASRFPRLASIASGIGEFRPLAAELLYKIEPDGRVADHASVALNRIRRDIERQHRLIQESLERFLRAHRASGVLQEEFVAIRNERFVLPVITGQQRKVEGIIHAASGTGHTLFIEPLETVELNNDLVRLQEQERREVYRILEEMTGRLHEAAADIAATAEALGHLELVLAKARFGAEFACVIPRLSPPGSPRLFVHNGRHPLLEDVLRRQGKAVVPLAVALSGAERTLVISGPNTGGKTVALKTVGIFALMAQAGLPVPCDECELPLFGQVLADIGDQQSIEQSLSTFSAHIARIREMAGLVNAESLVLLDELGRATDPDEGGALGVAILEHMRRAGAFTFASTHLVAPKIYGSTAEGVVNASMSFDEGTLEPTYILRTGAPGASAGLDIARRLGLPEEVIERARASLGEAQREMARFSRILEERIESAARKAGELEGERRALEAEQARWRAEWEKREAARRKEIEGRMRALLEDFEKRAREAIERIAASAEQNKQVARAERKVAQARREMREEFERAALADLGANVDGNEAPPAIEEGARVRLRGVREPARVRRVLKDGIEVEAGFLKLQVSLDDVLEVLPGAPEAPLLPRGVTVQTADRGPVLEEINVIGKRADEAIEEVDKFLDRAALAGLTRVRIVHGHGMGVLKKAIAEMLRGHPHVERFSEASLQEGGAGATVAELREG